MEESAYAGADDEYQDANCECLPSCTSYEFPAQTSSSKITSAAKLHLPERIKKKFPHILENIDVEMVDVGDKMNDDKLDEKALIKAIKEKEHSILFLAFCWTNRLALNDILRAAGIYAHLIMTEDRKEITNGRYFTLDEIQKEVIDEVVKNPVQNVFLWGSSGTGKTLLLAMILSMKISHYLKKGIKVNIIGST